MLGFAQDLVSMLTLLGALASGGILLSARARRNKLLVILCITWAVISFAYLFRPILKPSDELFAAFDRPACINAAKSTVGLFELKTKTEKLSVRDFRTELKTMDSATDYESLMGETTDFVLYFYPKDHRFSIMLKLVDHPNTPTSTSLNVAEYFQHDLCLTKQQVCELNYDIGAPRATNMLFPDLSGQDLIFEYCE